MQRDGGRLDQRALFHRKLLGYLVGHLRRYDRIGCETARAAGQADKAQIFTKIVQTFAAGIAISATKDWLDSDTVADCDIIDSFTQLYDLAAEFVTHGNGGLVVA